MVEDSTNPIDALDIEMDAAGLYTEEVVTDRRVGTIRVMTPVKTDGQRDLDRPMLFVGETQIMTQMGPYPSRSRSLPIMSAKRSRSSVLPPRTVSRS